MTGQGSQREIADKWNVERSTVVHVVKLAKDGALERLAGSRPGGRESPAIDVALEDALAENERPRETITKQATSYICTREKGVGADRPSPGWTPTSRPDCSTWSITPSRAGWSTRRACGVLQCNPIRLSRWRHRRDAGVSLDAGRPGPDEALHALPE